MSKSMVVLVMGLVAFGGFAVAAVDGYWDINPSTPGAQVGNGVWNSTNLFWWDPVGLTNFAWPATYDPNYDAFFGAGDGTPYTVTLGQTVYVNNLTIEENANVTLEGEEAITIWGDPAILAFKPGSAVINCDIARHTTGGSPDPGIAINGDSKTLVINGDVYVDEIPSGTHTEDLVLRRNGAGGANPAYIDLNGTVFFNSTDGVLSLIGYHSYPDNSLAMAKLQVNVNGTINMAGNAGDKGIRLRTGATMNVKGRVETQYINFFPNTSVPNYSVIANRPKLKGDDSKTGVLAFPLAKYTNDRFIKNDSNNGGIIEAANLNLEIIVPSGFNFATGTSAYRLVDQKGASGGYITGGPFNSVVVNEPAGVVGTIVTFSPADYTGGTGGTFEQDLWINVETADLNGNGKVNLADFALFALQYGKTGCGTPPSGDTPPSSTSNWCSGADFNHDTVVDIADLALFVSKWLAG